MACGDRYRHLIRTREGATIERPFSRAIPGVADELDASDWLEAARDLASRVNQSWGELIATESGSREVPATANPVSPTLAGDLQRYREDVDNLPSRWTLLLGGWSSDLEETSKSAMFTMETGVCLLDRIHAAIEKLDGTAPSVPENLGDKFKSKQWTFTELAAVAAIGGLAYLGIRNALRSGGGGES